MEENGFIVKILETGEDALEEAKDNIEVGSSVIISHLTILEQIGFLEYLDEGDHSWENS